MSLSSNQIRNALIATAACAVAAMLGFQITTNSMAPWWSILIGCVVGAVVGFVSTDPKRSLDGLIYAGGIIKTILRGLLYVVPFKLVPKVAGMVWPIIREPRPLLFLPTLTVLLAQVFIWKCLYLSEDLPGLLGVGSAGILSVLCLLLGPTCIQVVFVSLTVGLESKMRECNLFVPKHGVYEQWVRVLGIILSEAEIKECKNKGDIEWRLRIKVDNYIVSTPFLVSWRAGLEIMYIGALVYLRVLCISVGGIFALAAGIISSPIVLPVAVLFLAVYFFCHFVYYTYTRLVLMVVVNGLAGALITHVAMISWLGDTYFVSAPFVRLGACLIGAVVGDVLVYFGIHIVARRILHREPAL